MRKITTLLFLLFCLTLLNPFSFSWAAPVSKATFFIGQKNYLVNGQLKKMDAAAFMESGRAYVPVRYLADALGVSTGWEEKTQTITLTAYNNVYITTVTLVAGSKTLSNNGQSLKMNVAPVMKNGRTYLPAKWIAEAFGYEVNWNPEFQTVLVRQ